MNQRQNHPKKGSKIKVEPHPRYEGYQQSQKTACR